MNERLDKIYKYLSSQNIKNLPTTYDEFVTLMDDDEKAQKVHSYLLSQNIKNVDKDFNVFSEFVGRKKKDFAVGSVSATASQGSSTEQQPSPLTEQPKLSSEELQTKISELVANSRKPQNPFIQPAVSTAVSLDLKPLEQPKTIRDYINERGVTLNNIGLPENVNIDRPLREGEEEGFNSLLKAKGLSQPPKTSYFWGAGKAEHYVASKVLRDIGSAMETLKSIPELEKANPLASLGKSIAGVLGKQEEKRTPAGLPIGEPRENVFKTAADWVESRAEGIPQLPSTELGKLIGGAIGLEPLFIEMAVSPEVKLATIGGKTIKASRFLTQMTGEGFVNRYASQIEKDKSTDKALLEGLKGAGGGALTATIFTKLGYGSSKLGEAVMKSTKSGFAGGLTNAVSNAVGFGGFTLGSQIVNNQPINFDEIRQSMELGGLLAVPAFAHFAGIRATGNYLTSSPAMETLASKVIMTPTELRDKAFDIREKSKAEPDIQKRASLEMVANFIDAIGDVKVLSREVKENPEAFIKTLEESDLPKEQVQIFKDKIYATASEGMSTPEIDAAQKEIDDLKGKVKGIKDNDKIPESVRKAETEPINEKIKAKEEELVAKVEEHKTTKEQLKIGDKTFKSKKELFNYLDKNAVNADGSVNKGWFDYTEDMWPEPKTIKAIEEWTDVQNKKVREQTKIKEETEDAERIRREAEKAGEQAQGVVGEEEGGLRVRDTEKDRLEAVTGEKIVTGIKDLQQEATYDCGVCALRTVLSKFGIEASQKELIDETKPTEKSGVKLSAIVENAQSKGLNAEMKEGMTPDDLRKSIDNDTPIIILQNGVGETEAGKDYSGNKDGHYITIKGYDKEGFIFEDPASKDGDLRITEKDLIDRWHGLRDDEKTEATGIGITITKPTIVPQESLAKQREKVKPKSRTETVLSETPESFEESLLQFFLRGGRIKTDDFVRYTGYKRGSPEFKSYIWAIKNEGTSLDVLNESIETFGKEGKGAMDMINETVDLLIRYPGRGSMLERLEKYREEKKGQVIPESAKTEESDLADMEFDIKIDPQETRYFDEEYEALDDVWKEYFVDGKVNWDKISTQLKENEGFFTSFPFDLNKNELSLLKKILGNESEKQRIEFISQGISGIYDKGEKEDALRGDTGVQREPTAEQKPEIAPKEAISEAIPEKEGEVPPPPEEPVKPPETAPQEEKPQEGVTFKDKTYQSVEEVQDAFAEGKLTFEEQKPLIEKVRKFEDGLRADAVVKSVETGKKLGMVEKNADKKLTKNKDDFNKLSLKLFPVSISQANTALWKPLSKVRDGAAKWIANGLQRGMNNQLDAIRWLSQTVTNWYGGLARTTPDILAKLKMTGTVKEFAPYEAKQINEKLLTIVNTEPEALRRVRDVLDPEIATEKLTYEDLTASEQNLHDALREWNTWVHETNYANGFIPTDTYLKFKNPDGTIKYIARLYDTYELPAEIEEFIRQGQNTAKLKIDTDIFKMRKEVDDWKKEHAITDPVYLTTKRVMQTIQNGAIKEYMDYILKDHPDFVKDVKKGEEPPKGYTKLGKSNKWGQFKDKYVVNNIVEDFTGFFFANHLANVTYDALKLWDRNKVNQFYKKFRTVYNPFVQAGNFTGNLFFASITGVNPAVLISKMPEAMRHAKEGTDLYKTVLKSGILGRTGITGDMTPRLKSNASMIDNVTKAQGFVDKAVNLFEKADEKATKLYQGADNVAKMSAYLIFREQGLTHEQAIRRTYDSFQNYATVGKIWDVASKTPLVGNKFIKFQADLQRILLNAVTTSPLTTIGTLALIKLIGDMTSALSGEDPEKKKIRESRKGVAKIPLFGDFSIPLSFKVGKKEINVARYFSPLYLYRYSDSETDIAELSRFLPFQIQKVDVAQLGEKRNKIVYGDPAFGWIGAVLADRDFRGASIQNPQASRYINPNITTEERLANVLNYVARSQVPFYKSAQDIYDGITGQLDYYGRKRSWSDAIINNLVKIQEFDDPELKKYMEGNINYLTSRFTTLTERMGDANSVFLKELRKAEEQGMSEKMLDKIYKEQDRKRSNRLQQSLEQQVPVMEELERIVGAYKKWNPEDPFVQQNFLDIEAGKNQRFNVLDEIDLQKKYKTEYRLLKENRLLRKPDIPNYFQGEKWTEDQKKEYTSIYWSEFVRNMDMFIGLTQEEIDEAKGVVTGYQETLTAPELKENTLLNEMASEASRLAREVADAQMGIKR